MVSTILCPSTKVLTNCAGPIVRIGPNEVRTSAKVMTMDDLLQNSELVINEYRLYNELSNFI